MLLQVVMMPSPGDEIARILASIGQSLPMIFNREGLERQKIMDQIAANPTYGQQLASQVRASTAEGSLDANQPGLSAVGQQLGLDMGNPESQAFLAALAQTFPATLEEQTGALATGAAVGLAASPTAQLQHEATTTGLQEQIQVSSANIIAAMNQEQREQYLQNFNYPLLAAQYQVATDALGIEDTEQKMKAWKELDAFIEANPELAGPEAAGLTNPAFLEYLSLLQRLSVEERLALAKNTNDPLEALGAVISLGQERNRLWNSIREAKAADASDEEIAALNAQWEDVDSTGQLIASQVPGLSWSTIALPGSEMDPITFRTPRKWSEYTTSYLEAEQAAIMDNLLSSYSEWVGLQLAGGRNRGDILAELRQDDPEFWNAMMQSGALGEWMAEINRWVTEQEGEAAAEVKERRARDQALEFEGRRSGVRQEFPLRTPGE